MTTSCAYEFRHDDAAAARVAERLVYTLAVEKDVPTAYNMIDPASRQGLSLVGLERAIQGSSWYGKVNIVTATHYEPVPGEAAVDIFLTGTGNGRQYYFVVRLSGTADKGYRPAHFAESDQPLPASSMREPLSQP
jgi:hypothetical protein